MEKLINNQKITSLQIAELTGKRHDVVLRAIRKMEDSWVRIGQHKFTESFYLNSQNKKQPMYGLTKPESLYIATKFNDEARAKLVLRWEELENSKPVVPLTRMDILKIAMEAEQEKEKLEKQNRELQQAIKTDAPKVTFANSVMGSSNSVSIGDFAKIISNSSFKIGRNRLFQWLRDNKYLMRNNIPYQNYMDMGLFEVIERSFGSGEETFTTKTTKITGKGQLYFTEKLKAAA